jgi:hypothetical protein
MAYHSHDPSDAVRGCTTADHLMRHLFQWLILVGVCVLTGCASTRSGSRAVTPTGSNLDEQTAPDPLTEAFRAGMEAGLHAYAEHYLDNDFPYYNWSTPLVQRTWMPPRMSGGMFYPGHMAEVLITPGAWKREYAAPISSYRGMSEARRYLRERPAGAFENDGPPDGPFPFVGSSVATPLRPSRYSTSVSPVHVPVPDQPPHRLPPGSMQERLQVQETWEHHPTREKE